MTVKEGGFVAPGLLIEVRRSVSGVVDGDSWSTVTDAGGLGLVTVEVDPDGPFRHTGVSGYYRVKAIDASTGVVRGEWGSIPLNGPTESLYLPVGGHPLENAPVLFGDAGLEAAVRVLAGVENGDLTTSDVGHLVSLDLTRSDISSLAGLEDLVFLEAVTLTENQVDDLGPLSAVRNLRHLDADHNQVTDLRPLRGLRSLTFLDLAYNHLSDVSVLSSLPSLETLNLDANDVQDLSGLGRLSLTTLRLRQNDIAHIEDLATFTGLLYLDVSQSPIQNFSPLSNLAQLKELAVEGCGVVDVSAFRG
jgi:Leucine-rich repeat (LRR) protein